MNRIEQHILEILWNLPPWMYVVVHYVLRLIPMLVVLSVVLFCLGACSTTVVEYVDTGRAEVQAEAVQAVLRHCIDTEVGKVGGTNASLAKGYLRSTESLLICQESSNAVVDYLNR